MTAINALRTSVSGLNAQATKLSGISNNIANSSTVGYKRIDTQFESLVLEGSSHGSSALAGTAAHNRVEITKLGQVQSTGVDTDIAVNGNGFLVVNETPGSNGKYLATRAGSFRPDANGNLVNAGGYYLQGVKLGADGLPLGTLGDNNVDGLATVNINNISVSSAPTTEMTFWANLPAGNTAYSADPPGVDTHISSVDYYDALGGTQTLTYRFIALPAAAAGDTDTNRWLMQVYDSATGGDPAAPVTDESRLVGQVEVEFWGASAGANKAGTIKSVVSDTAPVPPATTPISAAMPEAAYGKYTMPATADQTRGVYDTRLGTLTMQLGSMTLPLKIGVPGSVSGITQLSGNFVPTKIEKNGSAFGMLERVSVDDDGKVIATFSNGQSRPIYQLKIAVFPNADGLNPVSGDAYEMSRAAGAVRLLTPGEGSAGTTSGRALESSNVDIGTELTNLIETQRAYSSNASVVRTADQMLEEATNLKR
ncbi:flagellar hook protein FlgE [Roseomonas marmotae]|uniref:Flagellar hook protein FlgE n=1 Tax=Roseomonas marmotae TaxID=2768161 RepID=A0ABS3KF02_9PROT|nr:flagellar hook protein FlgE [Roseomonas marmotae]MBO1076049.1 flagellar hook protein FlgE [Roseomonas marmotae]QTI81288.1 flagellar hook protein FlgE [Roseomonas marmotae]